MTIKTRKRSNRRAPVSAVQGVPLYEITNEPLPDAAFDRLPPDVQDRINALYEDVMAGRIKAALPAITALIEKYPDVPQLHNYLYIALFNSGDRMEASRVVQETVRRFPDYLFGRIALAEACLRRGEPENIPEIFGGQFDLTRMYPKRRKFHLSEVLNFLSIVARYHHALGSREQALQAYATMGQLDSEHPSTHQVGSVLRRWRFGAWIRDKFKLPST